jgi:hypothetical protein
MSANNPKEDDNCSGVLWRRKIPNLLPAAKEYNYAYSLWLQEEGWESVEADALEADGKAKVTSL